MSVDETKTIPSALPPRSFCSFTAAKHIRGITLTWLDFSLRLP